MFVFLTMSLWASNSLSTLEEIGNWVADQSSNIDSENVTDFINKSNEAKSAGSSFGVETIFTTSTIENITACRLDDNRFVLSYETRDTGNYSGKVIIGTISNNNVTFGNPVTFSNSSYETSVVKKLNDNSFVIAYNVSTYNSKFGRTLVGNITSGNQITINTATDFSSNQSLYNLDINVFNESTFMMAYRIGTIPNGATARVGTITNNLITYGSESSFNQDTASIYRIVPVNDTQCVINYRNDNVYGTSKLVTRSGSNITFSQPFHFNTEIYKLQAVSLTESKFVVLYVDNYSSAPKGKVGTLADGQITFGPEYYIGDQYSGLDAIFSYDSNSFVVAFRMSEDTNISFTRECSVSGNEITAQQPVIYDMDRAYESELIGLTSTKYAVAYRSHNEANGYMRIGQKTNLPDTPTILSRGITARSDQSATFSSYLYWVGEPAATVRGVCWSTSQNPTINDFTTEDGSEYGIYSSILSNLTASTTYYVRSYATNTEGTTYGEEVSFTTLDPAIIWNGPTINFSKADNADYTLEENQDRITNNVWITRQNRGPIYNIAIYDDFSSSNDDLEWAYGTTANYGELTYYTNIKDLTEDSMPALVNRDVVLHIIADNIYIDINFTHWTSGGSGGGFAYTRSTAGSVSTDYPSESDTQVEVGTTINPTINLDNAEEQNVPETTGLAFTPSYQNVFSGTGIVTITFNTNYAFGAFYQSGTWNTVANNGGTITFENVNFDIRGDVAIVLGGDDTLPVELSSFNAIQSSDNNAEINWVTASESNLIGYNIFRAESDDVNQAERVNPEIISANNTATGANYSYTDNEVEFDINYYYWLSSVELNNETNLFGPVVVKIELNDEADDVEVPNKVGLIGIYPNPFNPTTSISFNIDKESSVEFNIYNIKGQLVYSYDKKSYSPGRHIITWNGQDKHGENCTSGMYLFKMISSGSSYIQKAMLLK
jgi:hypothetical protein